MFPSRNRKSFSTVMLSTVTSRLAFYMTDSKTETWKEVNFVEFNWRKWNRMFEISRYLSQELCHVGLNISPHIVSVALSSASSAKNTSFFLIMKIYLLLDCKTVVFGRFRKARTAVSVILACEAREPHTPLGLVRRQTFFYSCFVMIIRV